MRQTKIIFGDKTLRYDKYNKLPYSSKKSTTSHSSKSTLSGDNNNRKTCTSMNQTPNNDQSSKNDMNEIYHIPKKQRKITIINNIPKTQITSVRTKYIHKKSRNDRNKTKVSTNASIQSTMNKNKLVKRNKRNNNTESNQKTSMSKLIIRKQCSINKNIEYIFFTNTSDRSSTTTKQDKIYTTKLQNNNKLKDNRNETKYQQKKVAQK